ncbi:MAG TPA: aldolase [Acidobacteriaceae bacterium]|nr:aldolase [Acidobacteriaceae bacterium]
MLNADDVDVKAMHAMPAEEADPLLSRAAFPLRATYFPLGFPLEVTSNSPAILELAEQSWGHHQARFSTPPLELRLGVHYGHHRAAAVPPAPVFRLQWNLLLNVADAHNFVVTDLEKGRSFGWVAQSTLDSPLYLRYHLLEAAALSMLASLRAAPLHAACVCPFGCGILLCGDSGAGKSTLAYAGARAGWTFVCDDASYLPLGREDRLVVGNCHQIRFRSTGTELFPELEGRPITPRAAGKPSIEVPTAELSDVATASSAFVEYIVVLNRSLAGVEELAPLPKQSIRPWLEQSLLPGIDSRTAREDLLRRFFGVEVFELRYQNLAWAVERLQQLVLTGR